MGEVSGFVGLLADCGVTIDWLDGATVQGRADAAEGEEYRDFYTGFNTCGSNG